MEQLYIDVRGALTCKFVFRTKCCRFSSKGLIQRLRDALCAVSFQGDINHVTGDVHYLTYFLNRRRTILTIHDCVGLERLRGLRRFIIWLFWYWLPAKRCVRIVVISEATRLQVLKHIRCDPAKVRLIHNHVSDDFRPSICRFNEHRPRVLHIGTTPNKNLERHAAALQGIHCEFVIIGRLSNLQRVELDRRSISYKNYVDLSKADLVDQYEKSDLVLFASTYEGFGLPIVEAQAVGRPIISSDLWSMPEVAGGAACLVNPYEIKSIRNGVLRVIQDADYRNELIRLGYQNVKRFKLENTAAQYAELYREVFAQS
jgi:glycosyltransferase involved in cell wall biosynthesis